MRRRVLLLLGFFSLAFTSERDPYPKDYFRSPLGIPLVMAGNFAEMRGNHFHAGLDLKTNGEENYRIYAAADGYVSRIKVSPYGYGHALYVAHPNGYTTVYAHLSRFNSTLQGYVRRQQYRAESFALDKYFDAGTFPVKKGEVIAYSGNTGGSSAPHLHFEIRDSATQQPINPLLFGLEVQDTTPPRLFAVKIYAMASGSYAAVYPRTGGAPRIATPTQPVIVEAEQQGSRYVLSNVDRIDAHGQVAFSLRQHDYHEGSSNRLGSPSIVLTVNGALLFSSYIEKINFNQTRYLNAHVDYAERRQSRGWFQRSFVLPGNPLPYYRSRGNGILQPRAGESYEMTYMVEDSYHNTSRLDFVVRGVHPSTSIVQERPGYDAQFRHDRAVRFRQDGLRLDMRPGSLYEDTGFTYGTAPGPAEGYSRIHRLHDDTVPIHRSYTLAIRPEQLPTRLRPYALLARIDDEGNTSSAGGSFEDGWVTTRLRSFGNYFVAVDTTPPEIEPVSVSGRGSLRLRIKDDFSGVGRYRGTVDDQWVLFQYDPKRRLIWYDFDDRVGPGTHTLRVEVTDNKGNQNIYTTTFTR